MKFKNKMEIVWLLVGLIIGAIAAGLVVKFMLQGKAAQLEERGKVLGNQLTDAQSNLKQEQQKSEQLNINLSSAQADMRNLETRLSEERQQMEDLQTKFQKEFENMANKILEEKSSKFAEQNKSNLKDILDPLKEKINTFEKKVDETNKENIDRHAAMRQQLLGLRELNQQMSEDAQNLAKALKGDSKVQGNYGEIILERILEQSGLTKDKEYFTQTKITNADGHSGIPDVIVRMPDKKYVIIDSKVSLTAFERYASSKDEQESEIHLKRHLDSIRAHIKGLSEKRYEDLHEHRSPDFVLLFVPIEPAFVLATQKDSQLFDFAFSKNIVMVSSTTLFATLKVIASIWKQEYQNRNAFEIADQAGKMYDKFVGFVEDLDKIGERMRQLDTTYNEAVNKLQSGTGNLVSRAQKLKKLGAKSKKKLPENMVDRAEEENGLPQNTEPTAEENTNEPESKSLFGS